MGSATAASLMPSTGLVSRVRAPVYSNVKAVEVFLAIGAMGVTRRVESAATRSVVRVLPVPLTHC